MRLTSASLILSGALLLFAGCKADQASRASSQLGEHVTPTVSRDLATTTPATLTEAAASTAAAPTAPRPIIVCFGDSLTAGYGADDGQSYPDFLQRDLDREGFHYRVVNEGISGNTTKDGLDRINTVLALHPDVVVLEFGGNDGLRGLKVQTTRTNLAEMITTLQHSGAKVVLAGITLPPDYGHDYITAFTQTYPMLAKKYDLPVLPFLLQDVYGVQGLMQADNIHATDRGNAIVARNVLPFVEPLLKK